MGPLMDLLETVENGSKVNKNADKLFEGIWSKMAARVNRLYET